MGALVIDIIFARYQIDSMFQIEIFYPDRFEICTNFGVVKEAVSEFSSSPNMLTSVK